MLLPVAFLSCNKDPYEIGFDLLPPSDTLNVRITDTCTVEAFSVRQDSVRTDHVAALLFGSMMDPVFGRFTASFFTQAKMAYDAADFGTNPTLDSLVLVLPYSGFYGDTLTRLNMKVYEISDEFAYDSVRYSNQVLGAYPTLLADKDFVPRLSDSIMVFHQKTAPHLRVNLTNLSNYLGNKILTAPKNVLASNTEFLKFFRGLNVSASPVANGGLMLNFSIGASNSKMVLYFHNQDDPQNDSLHFDFLINTSCARFVHADHGGYLEASQSLKQQVLNRDSAQGARQFFLQGLGGIKVKVKLPYMANFSQGNIIAINEAILRIKDMDNDTIPGAPASLFLVRQDSAGNIGQLIDESEGSGYFGGTYDNKNHTYSFRITQHLQKVIQNEYTTHFDLYLMVNTPVTNNISPRRVVLYGDSPTLAADLENRFQLKMTYTILNKE